MRPASRPIGGNAVDAIMRALSRFAVSLLAAVIVVWWAAQGPHQAAATPGKEQPGPNCLPGQGQTPVVPCLGGGAIPYPSGWNLVAGPSGTVVTGAAGPLYTWQAGDTAYETIAVGSPLQAGHGYWVYFATPTSITFSRVTAQQSVTASAPAGQFVMIGNPFPATATVHGADVVYAYDPAHGYQQGITLQAGQGAWAYSASGGTVTITSP